MMSPLTRIELPPAVRPAWVVAVDVNGRPATNLALVEVLAGFAAEGVTATFECADPTMDIGQARELAARGARISARLLPDGSQPGAADWAVFDGFVAAVRVEFSPEGRRILLDAIDPLRFAGGSGLVGRHTRTTDDAFVFAPDAPLVFNEAGRPNRSAEPATFGERTCFVFEDRADRAAWWSVSDIANYLLATRVPADLAIALPPADAVAAMCGDAQPTSVDLTGLSLPAALERVARLGDCGFAIEPAPAGGRSRLRWFPGAGLRTIALRHQDAGSALSADTSVWSGQIAFSHDATRHVWVALGEPERVESTFTLLAGWNAALEGGAHRAYSRANPAFLDVADVYRRWVLNEAGDWSAEPFNRGPAADLSGVLGLGDCVPRRRRFLPTLSRDAAGRSLGVVIEVSYDSGVTWRNYTGRVEVLADEAGVRVVDDQLPPDYWQAAVAGTLAVRVTACIESDRRARAEWSEQPRADDRRTVEHVRWFAGALRRCWVHASSVLSGRPADEADDRAAASASLALIARRAEPAVAGQLALPCLSAACQVGDRIAGIGGQELSFDAGAALPRVPLVRRVRHRLADHWFTSLELE